MIFLEKKSFETFTLVKTVDNFLKEIFKISDDCSNLIKDGKERVVMKKDPFSYISNPLNAFLLIKRLSFDVINKINKVVEIE